MSFIRGFTYTCIISFLILPLLACAESDGDKATMKQEQPTAESKPAAEPATPPETQQKAATPPPANPAPQTSSNTPDKTFEENVHYVELYEAKKAGVAPGKIEVVEMFWYGCPHCYTLEPYFSNWKQTAGDNVEVITIPSVLNPHWEVHAKAFYAAESIGMLDKFHTAMFQAIHDQRRHLSIQASILRFVSSIGIDQDKFLKAWDSEEVNKKVEKAKELGKAYQLTGVPAIMVAGKYRVLTKAIRSYEEMFEIVDFLIKKEQMER